MTDEFGTLRIEQSGSVATIHMINLTEGIQAGRTLDFHWEIGVALGKLRDDQDVRVVILTGARTASSWSRRERMFMKNPRRWEATMTPRVRGKFSTASSAPIRH